MSDQTLADEIAAVFAEVEPVLADAFLPDHYEITRDVRTETGYGTSDLVPQVVESGRCLLEARDVRSTEGIRADRIDSDTAYVVTMPLATTLGASDQLAINDRPFNVSGVQRGGAFDVFVTANVEEA